MLEHSFPKSETIPGPHSFPYVMASEYGLPFPKLSGEPSLHPVFIQRKENEISTDDAMIGSYVSCLYEKKWYNRIVEEVSPEENNILVKLLHPYGRSVCLH